LVDRPAETCEVTTTLESAKPTKYKLLSAFPVASLNDCVNSALAAGWELYGEPFAVVNVPGIRYSQAVVKYEDKEGNACS